MYAGDWLQLLTRLDLLRSFAEAASLFVRHAKLGARAPAIRLHRDGAYVEAVVLNGAVN